MEYAGKFLIEYPSRSDVIRLWSLADFHIWNRNCAIDRLKADIAAIAEDTHAFAVGNGDYGDFITWTDKRFDAEAIAENVTLVDLSKIGSALSDAISDVLWPIKSKLIGLGFGNHEKKYMVQREHSDMHGALCYKLGVPNLGLSARFDVVFQRNPSIKKPRLSRGTPAARSGVGTSWTVRVYQHHGAGAAQTAGGKVNRLVNFMHMVDADLYLIAHLHDETQKKLVRIDTDRHCTRARERVTLGTITGTYLRTCQQGATGYGEIRGYAPTPLGAVVVEFEPDKQIMRMAMEAEVRNDA